MCCFVQQEIYSPSKTHIAATLDVSEVEQLTQELAISENVRSDLTDKMEALEQQKSIFQQSIAESRGELNMLEAQHKQLQTEHKELQNSYRELEKKYVERSKIKRTHEIMVLITFNA